MSPRVYETCFCAASVDAQLIREMIESSNNMCMTDSNTVNAKIHSDRQHGGLGYDKIRGSLSEKAAGF
jgi:hypothetical protein